MKKRIAIVAAVVVVGMGLAAWAASFKCAIDDQWMNATGKSRMESGKILYEYKCAQGHVLWVVAQ
jgi:hypothetical protein